MYRALAVGLISATWVFSHASMFEQIDTGNPDLVGLWCGRVALDDIEDFRRPKLSDNNFAHHSHCDRTRRTPPSPGPTDKGASSRTAPATPSQGRFRVTSSWVGGRLRFGHFAGEIEDAADRDVCAGPDAKRPVPPEPFASLLVGRCDVSLYDGRHRI